MAFRVGGFCVVLLACAWMARAHASEPAPASELERCSVIVTGTDQRSRDPGLARCLLQVLVKLSGDPSVADHPRAAGIVADAPGMVEDFVYFDRMSDVPMHDEQGSRDRPFDLVVHFDPAKTDRALASLDRKPWRGARPALLAGVLVKDQRGGVFTLSADANAGERQRESLFAAGALYGMRVALLPESALPPAGATPVDFASLGAGIKSTAVVPLTGTLRWSDPDFGWVGSWTLTQDGKVDSWEVKGVSFDEAFRSAVGGAARILSQSDRPR